MIFIRFSVSLWKDFTDPVFDGVGLAGFKSTANAFFYLSKLLDPFFVFYCLLFLIFLPIYLLLWAGVFGLIGCQSLSPDLALPMFLTIYRYMLKIW